MRITEIVIDVWRYLMSIHGNRRFDQIQSWSIGIVMKDGLVGRIIFRLEAHEMSLNIGSLLHIVLSETGFVDH